MHEPLTLIYQDDHLLAVHKPAGLLVHRTALDAHAGDDLVTRLRAQTGAPVWPAHRLDKGTSGVLLLARDAATARLLGEAFAAASQGEARRIDERIDKRIDKHIHKHIHKRYLALVRGWPAAAGEIDQPLARDPELPSTGQPQLPACTRWRVLQRLLLPLATDELHADTRLALVEVQPLTGRRHQIRRHFKALAHPLIGDATHGKGPLNRALAAHIGHGRLWLHALQLSLPHPVTGLPLVLRAEPEAGWHTWHTWHTWDTWGIQGTGVPVTPGAPQPPEAPTTAGAFNSNKPTTTARGRLTGWSDRLV